MIKRSLMSNRLVAGRWRSKGRGESEEREVNWGRRSRGSDISSGIVVVSHRLRGAYQGNIGHAARESDMKMESSRYSNETRLITRLQWQIPRQMSGDYSPENQRNSNVELVRSSTCVRESCWYGSEFA